MPSDKTPITLDPDVDPWEQQPGETSDMHARFLAYLRAGPARTVRQTAEQWGRSPGYLHQIAYRHHWKDRARAWDAEQQRVFLAELEDKRRAMVDEQLRDVADLRHALRTAHESLDPGAMSWTELARIADVLTKIERAALGEPSQTFAVHGVADKPPVRFEALPGSEAERQAQLDDITRRLAAAVADGADLDPADLDGDEGHA